MPTAIHWDGGDKYATGDAKICLRQTLKIASWNVRTLAQTGMLQELEHKLMSYLWHIIRLGETRWKSVGENVTNDGLVLYYSE